MSSTNFNETDRITPDDLEKKWLKTLAFYDQMIEAGHPLRPLRFLVRYIIDKEYNKQYFPGISMFNLLVSIPSNNKVDFTKTLNVKIDSLRSVVVFSYRDWTGLTRDKSADHETSLKWINTCQLTEVCDVFEHFRSINN